MSAELVDAAGKPLPYGLALVDLDKPDSLTLRLRAPAGEYDRLSLSIGVYPACNSGPQPAALVYPLNAGGGMTWTWTLGYIFVFMEGNKGGGHAGAVRRPRRHVPAQRRRRSRWQRSGAVGRRRPP